MPKRKWSQDVTEHSDALDLESGVFRKSDPKAIARSLKRSAEESHRRKADPFRSAMSMLTFYINRAGKDLDKHEKQVLEDAKDELRKAFGRA
jgi:hypothetical protein